MHEKRIASNFLSMICLALVYKDAFSNRPDWFGLQEIFYARKASQLLKTCLNKNTDDSLCIPSHVFNSHPILLNYCPAYGDSRLETVVNQSGRLIYFKLPESNIDDIYFYHHAIDFSCYAHISPRIAAIFSPLFPYFSFIFKPDHIGASSQVSSPGNAGYFTFTDVGVFGGDGTSALLDLELRFQGDMSPELISVSITFRESGFKLYLDLNRRIIQLRSRVIGVSVGSVRSSEALVSLIKAIGECYESL